jgi:hypothetical protein
VIYFIQDTGSLCIKIGYTGGDVMARLNALQTGNASRLEVIACVPGEMTDEAALHVRFAMARVGGEWFRPTADLLRHLAFVVIGGGMYEEGKASGYTDGHLAGENVGWDSATAYYRAFPERMPARTEQAIEYSGVTFPTWLEAKWAAFFDLIEWAWQYKPPKIGFWQPEFKVTFPCAHSECSGSHTLLCAVRPFASIRDFDGHLCLTYPYGGGQGDDGIPADSGAAFGNHPRVSEWEMGHGSGGGEYSFEMWLPEPIDPIWDEAEV